eukprot:176841_1
MAGAVTLVVDQKTGQAILRMYDLNTMSVLFHEPLRSTMEYTVIRSDFHAFKIESRMVALHFRSTPEAEPFGRMVATLSQQQAEKAAPAPARPSQSRSYSAGQAAAAGSGTPPARVGRKKRGASLGIGKVFKKMTDKLGNIQYSDDPKTKKTKSKAGKEMVIGAPTNVQHKFHVGFDAKTGFSIENIPDEWLQFFSNAGLSSADLRNDAQLANQVMELMVEELGVPVENGEAKQMDRRASSPNSVPERKSSPVIPSQPRSSSVRLVSQGPVPPRRSTPTGVGRPAAPAPRGRGGAVRGRGGSRGGGGAPRRISTSRTSTASTPPTANRPKIQQVHTSPAGSVRLASAAGRNSPRDSPQKLSPIQSFTRRTPPQSPSLTPEPTKGQFESRPPPQRPSRPSVRGRGAPPPRPQRPSRVGTKGPPRPRPDSKSAPSSPAPPLSSPRPSGPARPPPTLAAGSGMPPVPASLGGTSPPSDSTTRTSLLADIRKGSSLRKSTRSLDALPTLSDLGASKKENLQDRLSKLVEDRRVNMNFEEGDDSSDSAGEWDD